jgi:hypothetical protein
MICKVEANLLFGRAMEVRKMLRPLVRGDSSCCRVNDRDKEGRQCVVLGSFSGSQPSSDFVRDWRFATPVAGLWGSYFERWIPADTKEKYYYLDRAYLHLYWLAGAQDVSEREILALHCDPNEPEEPANHPGLKHSRYKRGPHIHVSTAEQPMPHSHIALNLGHLPEVLASFENLTVAIRSAIQILNEQVIALYRAEGSSSLR